MEVKTNQLVVVGGPNGAGKTTFAEKYSALNKAVYLAADKIATEIAPDQPKAARLEAASRFVTQFDAALADDRRGVSNVYYIDGTRYYELPSGEISQSPQLGRQTDGAEPSDERER